MVDGVVNARPLHRLQLCGAFCMFAPDGRRVEIGSRKARALVAMLATASGGERSRSWLQDRLWGSRGKQQAQQSLRNELIAIRQALNGSETPLVTTRHDMVRLDIGRIDVDVRGWLGLGEAKAAAIAGEFLEGLDIPGEDEFEDWLRDQRRALVMRAQIVSRDHHALPTTPMALDASEEVRPVLRLSAFANATGGLVPSLASGAFDQDLLERTSRLRWLAVSAGAQTNAAGYQLTGDWRADHEGVALSVALSEARDSRLLWSQSFSLPASSDRSEMELVARNLVAAIDAQIEVAEQERVFNQPVETLRGRDMICRARWHLSRLTRQDAAIAQTLIDRVVADRPNSSETLIQAGFCRGWAVWAGRAPTEQIQEVRAIAARAIAADRYDARGHLLVGMAETWLRRSDFARCALEHAISLNPSLTQAHMQLGSALYLAGQPEAALAPMRMALKLNPHDTQTFCVFAELGVAHYMLGDHEAAVDFANRALTLKPRYWYAHLIKLNALAASGNKTGAARARLDLDAARPGFSRELIDWLPFLDQRWNDALAEGWESGA